MTKEKVIKVIKNVLFPFLIIGIFVGMRIYQAEQANEIKELEQQLSEIQEQLHISNDQLNQIYMRQEGERYMEDEKNYEN